IGDYRSSTFTASSDGHGGTTVVDPAKAGAAAAPHAFIAAMAGLGAVGATSTQAIAEPWRERPAMLAAPRGSVA
ncbi:MAG: hypothetical protein ABI306_10940, partial [Caulobacteraceae bacterium]